jgi:hypothetical protein
MDISSDSIWTISVICLLANLMFSDYRESKAPLLKYDELQQSVTHFEPLAGPSLANTNFRVW